MTTEIDFSKYYEEADAQASINSRNDVKMSKPFWTPQSGGAKWKTNRVRILPPPKGKTRDKGGDVTFYTWVQTHNLPGASYPVLCPNKYADEYCPACEIAQTTFAAGDKEGAKKWWPQARAMVNVIPLTPDGKGYMDKDYAVVAEPQVYLYGLPKRSNDDLQLKIEALAEEDPDPHALMITSPQYGRDVFIRRQGHGATDTRYEIGLAQSASPMRPEMLAALVGMHSLETEKLYEPITAAQMKPLLSAAKKQAKDVLAEEEEEVEYVEGEFALLPSGEPEDDNPFSDDDDGEEAVEEEESPFADDDDGPAQAPAAAKLSKARADLEAKLAAARAAKAK